MLRDLLNKLSGTHITLMVMTAILAPGALFAAVTYTAVGIIDPNTGTKSFVDAARRLNVYDPVAGYANYPANYVRINTGCDTGTSGKIIYTPPSGKSLIVKSVEFFFDNGTQGKLNYVNVFLIGRGIIASIASVNPLGSSNSNLGTGYYVKNNESIYQGCSVLTGEVSLVGYLVPANWVPAAGSADEAAQSVRVGPLFTGPSKH